VTGTQTSTLSSLQRIILDLVLGERSLGSSGSIRHKLRNHYSHKQVDRGIDDLIQLGLLESYAQTTRSRKGNVSLWLRAVDWEELRELLEREQRIALMPKDRLRLSMLATGECLRALAAQRTARGAGAGNPLCGRLTQRTPELQSA
jgi:hypothetical protein